MSASPCRPTRQPAPAVMIVPELSSTDRIVLPYDGQLDGGEGLGQPVGVAAGGGEGIAGTDLVARPQLGQGQTAIERRLTGGAGDVKAAGLRLVGMVPGDMGELDRVTLRHNSLPLCRFPPRSGASGDATDAVRQFYLWLRDTQISHLAA